MQQTALAFSDLEPCKHCGGQALEQWRLAEDWKGDEYIAVVMMCDTCTFETYSGTDRRCRRVAVENWNHGVIQQLAEPGGWGKQSRILTLEETWHFETEYMRRERPRLRKVKRIQFMAGTWPDNEVGLGGLIEPALENVIRSALYAILVANS